MKNLENACGYYQRTYQRPHEDNDPSKPQLYWDGYQWVIRPSGISPLIQDPVKPGRKVQISNVPLHLNLQVTLFKDYLIEKMIKEDIISGRDSKDAHNTIKAIEFNTENNTAILLMESIELAKSMILLDGIELLGHTLRVSLYKEVNNNEISLSNINKEAALANSAHISAKSAAISYAAFQSIFNTDNKKEITLNFNTGEYKVPVLTSKVIKIMNAVDTTNKDINYSEVLDDIKEECEKFGNIVSCMIIKKGKEKLGAELGAIFIEFQDPHSAEVCFTTMKGRQYEGKEIKVAFLDETVYKKEIID